MQHPLPLDTCQIRKNFTENPFNCEKNGSRRTVRNFQVQPNRPVPHALHHRVLDRGPTTIHTRGQIQAHYSHRWRETPIHFKFNSVQLLRWVLLAVCLTCECAVLATRNTDGKWRSHILKLCHFFRAEWEAVLLDRTLI